jgi:hypothetical protein
MWPRVRKSDVGTSSSNPQRLSVQQYNAAESKATAQFPIPLFMAFRPVTFDAVGWPTRIASEAELLRYVDHNFEAEVAALFKPNAEFAPIGYRNAFTLDEQALITTVRDLVAALTESALGRRIRPVTNLLVQIGPFRMIEQLARAFGRRPMSVFEAGPGGGYLGALLARAGHRYLSYDVAQSIYLWQSWLLQAIAGAGFTELVGLEASDAERAVLANGRVVHLPWWTYANFLGGTTVRADVIYSNSNLSEMTNLALRHVLHISRYMLAESEVGLFCFFSKGMPHQTPHEQIDDEFRIFGYQRIFDRPFFAYALNAARAQQIERAFAKGLELYNPSGRPQLLDAKDVVPIKRTEAPLDTQITQWLHGWQPPFVD